MHLRLAFATLALSLVAGAAKPATIPEVGKASGGKGQLLAHIKGLRSSDGAINCALFNSADGYPRQPEKAILAVTVPIANKDATCEFTPVTPGIYAISFMHDENGNGKMDMNFVGAPKEGHGASNDAHGFFAPPSFEDARFKFLGGTATIELTTVYL